jgi:hypothetical protein
MNHQGTVNAPANAVHHPVMKMNKSPFRTDTFQDCFMVFVNDVWTFPVPEDAKGQRFRNRSTRSRFGDDLIEATAQFITIGCDPNLHVE